MSLYALYDWSSIYLISKINRMELELVFWFYLQFVLFRSTWLRSRCRHRRGQNPSNIDALERAAENWLDEMYSLMLRFGDQGIK